MKKAAVMSGGTNPQEDAFYNTLFDNYDYLVAADMGMDVFQRLKRKPNALLGDFDSISVDPKLVDTEVHSFPQDKDKSDTEIAVDFCIHHNFTNIDILGGIGSRLDHTMANAYLLANKKYESINMRLLNPWHEVQVLTPQREIKIVGKKMQIISLLPITQTVLGVSIRGCRWNIDNGVLQIGESRGLSNYLENEEAFFQIAEGKLFVFRVFEKNNFVV